MPRETDPSREAALPRRTKSDGAQHAMTRRTFVGASAALYGGALLPQGEQRGAGAAGRAARPALLAPAAFGALPLGSVRARGWLLHQLELQRDGLTGHAENVLPATAPNSAWKNGDGEDWEKGPYYLKGLVPLAYTLGDDALKARAKAWIEPILASQRDDGFFGPKTNNDWWPRMVVTYLLRDYHEATGDARVLPFLTRYYRHLHANLRARPLRAWGRARAGDEIDTVFWLYERTGDAFLLPLGDLLAQQAYPWREIFIGNRFFDYGDDFHPKHNVNVPQALKMPVVYSRRSHKRADQAANRAAITHLMRDHGTPMGIFSGTEMLSGRSSVAGVETCSIVEYLLSAETALRILGDARIGDEIERVAFNALPAALSKNFRQHVYYTLPNNVSAVRGAVGYQDDHGDDRVPAPRSGFPCCCYNLHMGWPKLAQNAWAATSDGGLAALVYVPSEVSAKVAGGGERATLVCDTEYPFEDTVRLEVRLKRDARFPLYLRVPGWCKNPQITVNGAPQPRPAGETFAVVRRVWKNGDRVDIKLPMSVETEPGVNGSVSVRRGPLVYALGLSEEWKAFERKKPGFESYEVTSASPWNFALVLDANDPARSFSVVRKPGAKNPWETGKSPVALRVRGKRLEPWKRRFDGRLALDPPVSPVTADAPEQTLELAPFGSQMLRVSVFPVAADGPLSVALTAWRENFGGDYARRWLIFRGGIVRGGRLHLPFAAKGVAARAAFPDFSYQADVVVGAKGDAGILFRACDLSVGPDQYRGYYAGISAENGQIVLGKSNNAWTQIAVQPCVLEAGRAHRLRVEAHGSRIRVWVDDRQTPVLEARDDSFAAGSLGVRSYSDKAAFGNLFARLL